MSYSIKSISAKQWRLRIWPSAGEKHGAIPRDAIDYHVAVTDKSVET